jgi:hypothetical protein
VIPWERPAQVVNGSRGKLDSETLRQHLAQECIVVSPQEGFERIPPSDGEGRLTEGQLGSGAGHGAICVNARSERDGRGRAPVNVRELCESTHTRPDALDAGPAHIA